MTESEEINKSSNLFPQQE